MPKRHYLSQCYLKGFATREDDEAIWQYKKSTGVLRKKGIGNIAQRTDYYTRILTDGSRDEQVEEHFSRLENRWPPLVRILNDAAQAVYSKSLSLSQRMTSDDLNALLRFMFMHGIRVPAKMDFIRAYVMTKHPRRDQLTDDEVQNYVVGGLIGTHDEVIDDWIRRLREKGMNIFLLPAGSGKLGFFTSDDPLFIGGDIRQDSTRIVFPVHRRTLLMFEHPSDHHGDARAFLIRDKERIDEANVDMVANAKDEIYAHDPAYLHEILKKMGFEVELRESADGASREVRGFRDS